MDSVDPTEALLDQLSQGHTSAWQSLMNQFHPRLRRMIALRMDHRLAGRIDPSDVLQETYLDAFHQLDDYFRERKYPFFIWLRLLAGHRLNKLHRFHLGTQRRDATLEFSLYAQGIPEMSSAALAAQLVGREPNPEQAIRKAELIMSVQSALEQLPEIDREALALRHFEGLTTTESAMILGISEAAAGQRYLRALTRIRNVMKADAP